MVTDRQAVNQGFPDASPVPSSAVSALALRGRRGGRNLAALLFDEFASKIRSGLLGEGDKLPTESMLVQAYAVSRTVVREAISRLQAAGLVHTRHGIGTFVAAQQHTADALLLKADDLHAAVDVMALLELRVGLETESAALAAQRRSSTQLAAMAAAHQRFEASLDDGTDTVGHDVQFHRCIAEATGNRYFGDMLQRFGSQLIPRSRIASIDQPQRDPDYLYRVSREHEAILAAIERQDVDSARAAMRIHLTNSRERLRLAHSLAQSKAQS